MYVQVTGALTAEALRCFNLKTQETQEMQDDDASSVATLPPPISNLQKSFDELVAVIHGRIDMCREDILADAHDEEKCRRTLQKSIGCLHEAAYALGWDCLE
jgi:hypothetical protein